MHEAIHHILTHCGALKHGERLLIIDDPKTWKLGGPLGIGATFANHGRRLGAYVWGAHFATSCHGQEPPSHIAAKMRKCDLTVCLTQYSLAHTKARLGAKRFLSLPQYNWDVLNHPAVMVDYEAQAPNVRRFADAFSNGLEVRVIAAGTNVTMRIDGRMGNYCPGYVRVPGDLGSPPDIEANIAPLEGSGKGSWFDDLVMLAECGVGLNPLAKPCGNMLIDEGAFGSVHFGLGSNHTIGGKRDVGWHRDVVMPNASLWVDGVQMLKDGQLC